MKNLIKYIKSLDFEYAISYSGLRGEKFTKLEEENKKKTNRLEKEIESSRLTEKSELTKEIEDLKKEVDIYNSRIITNKGISHKSTLQIHKFRKDDKEIHEIFEILNSKFEEQHFWMCPPIFRDAIVFYSEDGEIKGILQMCFSCSWIKNENEEDFQVDYKIFPRLMNLLIKLGHNIENE